MATHSSIFAWRIPMDKGVWWALVHEVAKSRTRLSDFTSWTVALQAPLSVEFSKQEYWSELPFPPPGDLPDPGIEPMSLVSPALTGGSLLLSHLGTPPCSVSMPN